MVDVKRTCEPEFTARVVLELVSGKKSLSQASREYRGCASCHSTIGKG